MPATKASAIGKSILFGEHAVVYGHPAIAIPIHSIHVSVTVQPLINSKHSEILLKKKYGLQTLLIDQLDDNNLFRGAISAYENYFNQRCLPFSMTIQSSIPIAAGLGSSAAVAIAIIRGLLTFHGQRITHDEINKIAYQSEIIQHGNPSGIDNSVISYEKPVFFTKNMSIEKMAPEKDLYFVLADSEERTLTRDVVEEVHHTRERHPERTNTIFNKIGKLALLARNDLISGNAQSLGKLMNRNHALLQELDISIPKLDQLIRIARNSGAFGAKLCGGGKGGFMVCICECENHEALADQLRQISKRVIQTKLVGNA